MATPVSLTKVCDHPYHETDPEDRVRFITFEHPDGTSTRRLFCRSHRGWANDPDLNNYTATRVRGPRALTRH